MAINMVRNMSSQTTRQVVNKPGLKSNVFVRENKGEHKIVQLHQLCVIICCFHIDSSSLPHL